MPLALVTGASRGIGRAVAIGLAREGFDVGLCYKANREAALEVQAAIQATGRVAHVLALDVAAGEAAEAAVKDFIAEHGCPHVLVNNAGLHEDALFAMTSRASWDRTIATNLGSFYSITRPVVRQMLRQRRGRIVNIASVAGERGNAGQVGYSASKAGLIGATKALALEVAARGITVNAVSPGIIATDMTQDLVAEKLLPYIPMGRFGTAEEVAAVVVFLCSSAASYVTGQVFGVNGGMYT